jgi:flagella basal body P-ring formation protein FlgA
MPPRPRILVALAAGLALLGSACAAFADETVTIPNRVIYPGETIEPTALKEVTLRQGKRAPEAVAMAASDIEGKVARRTLLPGRYIPLSSVRDAYVVEQGAPVQVVFAAGALTISATAVTLQPGSPGDLVKVRNIDSGKVLSGTVMADGSVRVGAL